MPESSHPDIIQHRPIGPSTQQGTQLCSRLRFVHRYLGLLSPSPVSTAPRDPALSALAPIPRSPTLPQPSLPLATRDLSAMSASSHPPNIKMDLAPNHPYQAEEDIPPFPANVDIPELDPELKLPETKGEYSDLLLGCATFGYGVYDSPEHVRTVEPLKIVGMALEAGIGGFDTCEWTSCSVV